ncbi:hypothetical protein ZIOFF_018434 [Zingiber officinale]|uniref:Uncharacterized protein n=1 Tax=Zingiber officinale TaxID=94328 RepID=A0A8J5H6D1_ZINOF|nr:hypothetical protein ZIOFF_018434 [Zingiber officinale]
MLEIYKLWLVEGKMVKIGGQNNQFQARLTALLQEQNRIHGEQIQQLLQAREQESAPRCPTTSAHPVYKQFWELEPTEFKGTIDSIIAEEWIRSLEMIYDFMQLTDADKVRLSRVTTFKEAIDQALMSERDRNDMVKEAQNKRLSYQGRDHQESDKKKSVPSQFQGKKSSKQTQSRRLIVSLVWNSYASSEGEDVSQDMRKGLWTE